jgi:hypothetical protein
MDNITQTSSGLIGANTPDGQFVQMTVKLQPFNYTETTNAGVTKNVELEIGFENSNNSRGFGVMMEESDLTASNGNALLGRRSTIALYFMRPMNTASSCFVSTGVEVGLQAQNCSSKNQAILYEPSVGILDLNAQHVLTWRMKLYPITHKSWIAFQVDNNGWINMTQQACNCIDGNSGGYYELYPYAFISYCGGTAGGGISCSSTPANQSVSSAIDYVLIADSPVVSIPSGQILSSGAVPPPKLPQPGVTGSLTDFLQFEANSISPGNLYAGGMLLTIIVSGVTFGVLFGLSRRFNISVRHYGLFFTMFVLGLAFLGFYAQILPIWVPVMMALITFGIAFGVIKTGGASGGLVPD